MPKIFKLGHPVDDEHWLEHSHSRLYHKEVHGEDVTYIVAGLPSGDVTVFKNLVRSLNEECFLLYIHHSARNHAEGRYQSPLLKIGEAEAFLERFGAFLASDGRHDFWVHFPSLSATLVWDRHNLLYCYGPVPQFEEDLIRQGYEWGEPIIPVPHTHFFHPELDGELDEVLEDLNWTVSPLMPQDGQ